MSALRPASWRDLASAHGLAVDGKLRGKGSAGESPAQDLDALPVAIGA
ncbi:hypothetical protein ACI2JN_02510 [Ochrobactrum teleogrylli]